jgi:hypothetical protein
MLNLSKVGQGLVYDTALSEAFNRAVTGAKAKIPMHLAKEPTIKVTIYASSWKLAYHYMAHYMQQGFVVTK